MGKPPWSTKAFIGTVHELKHHKFASSGVFEEEMCNKGPREWTIQLLKTSEEAMESYMIALSHWCDSYISWIVQNHSMIHREMFDPNSRTVTLISILDLPSGFIHLLVMSPLPDLCED